MSHNYDEKDLEKEYTPQEYANNIKMLFGGNDNLEKKLFDEFDKLSELSDVELYKHQTGGEDNDDFIEDELDAELDFTGGAVDPYYKKYMKYKSKYLNFKNNIN
jgi:hypothetical protein